MKNGLTIESTPVNGNGVVKVNGGYITGGNYSQSGNAIEDGCITKQ